MSDPDKENPVGVVDGIAENIFHLCANLESRMSKGEAIDADELTAVIARLKDYAADLQVAASRIG